MSSPVSPGGSTPVSRTSNGGDIFTPSHRVKALLAQFDDSDSDQQEADLISRLAGKARPSHSPRNERARSADTDPEQDADQEPLPVAPGARFATRLRTDKENSRDHSPPDENYENAYTRVKRQLKKGTNEKQTLPLRPDVSQPSSEDDLAMPAPRRRLLKRKASPIITENFEAEPNRHQSRSASPLFFPSPTARRRSPSAPAGADTSDGDIEREGSGAQRSRFLAVVEKHRKQRLEKEAAEVAKKAARTGQLESDSGRDHAQRGSSPADDSSEESDMSENGPAKRLTKENRPTRKASKKALEEMNRETQRMSRNMQLAHQARTRKKVTKESLLARFNYSIDGQATVSKIDNKSTTASSAPVTDDENAHKDGTPPTSPMQEDTMRDCSTDKDRLQLGLEPTTVGKGGTFITGSNALVNSIAVPKPTPMKASITPATAVPVKQVRPIRVKWSKKDAIMARGGDSDSDLEIVTAHGKTRKFAVFEKLPKRKARETESHLALRSLAHLMGGDDKKRSSMNTVEMAIGLRKAAREQARRERQEKIEELRAKGVIVQTAEERDRDQQEVEDLVEKARQEAAEIQRREKASAKRDGTFVKDGLDEDESNDDEDDADFEEEHENDGVDVSGTEDTEEAGSEEDAGSESIQNAIELIEEEAEQVSEQDSDEDHNSDTVEELDDTSGSVAEATLIQRRPRNTRVVSDDEDHEEGSPMQRSSPAMPAQAKTPLSLTRSARKLIPGLPMSDDLPIGLTQAFAATMADAQTQAAEEHTQQEDSLQLTRDLPSPNIPMVPRLNRLESLDLISDSQPATQTQPIDFNLSFANSQQVPQSPAIGLGISVGQFTPSQLPFEPTQDVGYMLSPFTGSRFGLDTPSQRAPQSTIETVLLQNQGEESPILQRKGRLQRGRMETLEDDERVDRTAVDSAFEVMKKAAKDRTAEADFDRSRSAAKQAIDEAAEESEDEYAGLGGVSDDEAGEENEDDRKMIDEDTQIGKGDEAQFAGILADRERKQDEAAVSKLLKDITTGALRRKRGVGDELDLSDEEDAVARRREAKRREFAKMRRELLKDEAVGKIAEDRKKEAFLRSIEDREAVDDGEDDFDQPETPLEESQSQSQGQDGNSGPVGDDTQNTALEKSRKPLSRVTSSTLNRAPAPLRRTIDISGKRPTTLAEIRETVSLLIDEPDSQAATIDLGLSDSEDDAEAYVNLGRHLTTADADMDAENDDEGDGLGDFIVDDDGHANAPNNDAATFKKPSLPRPPYNERRTQARANVVDRLELRRQASSSSASTASTNGSSSNTKLAFYTKSTGGNSSASSLINAHSLLRRATTNSSLGSMAGVEVSATGVTTHVAVVRTERGAVEEEKEFIRKAAGGRRNAVNYRGHVKPVEEKMSKRAGVRKKAGQVQSKKAGSFLGGLFRGDSWG